MHEAACNRLALRRALSCFAALPAVLGLAWAPAPAHASAAQQSIVQDDQRLLNSGPAARDQTLDEIQSLGVDTVRAFVFWRSVAPTPSATVSPAGFDAADPATYGAAAWSRYDGLVRAAAARGLSIILTPTSPVPAWASQCSGSATKRRTCNPAAAEFGAFLRALGTRYSGAYAAEDGSGVLPRVSRWGIWNEPNVGVWLTPQFVRRGGRTVASSPARYRALAQAAIGGLQATGHRGDQILIGETGPIGHATGALVRRPVATAEFLRDLFCISSAGHKLRGAAARAQGCRGNLFLAAGGIAHHPYIQGGSKAPTTPARPDEIVISSPGSLTGLLGQAARAGRIPRGLPIFYTEFGFQTDPPDHRLGVSLSRQAAYLNQSLYMSYRQRRVQGLAQYLLYDDRQLGGFQSGLQFADGRAKPSLQAYGFPIWVVRDGIHVTVFGQVRPLPPGDPGQVSMQVKLPGKSFTSYRVVKPNPRGFVIARLLSKRGRWRLYYTPGDGGPARISRETTEATR